MIGLGGEVYLGSRIAELHYYHALMERIFIGRNLLIYE